MLERIVTKETVPEMTVQRLAKMLNSRDYELNTHRTVSIDGAEYTFWVAGRKVFAKKGPYGVPTSSPLNGGINSVENLTVCIEYLIKVVK